MTESKRRYHFIVNPFSTHGEWASKNLNQLLHKANLDYQVYEASRLFNIKEIIQGLQPHLHNKDIIVSVGGDGTLSEVVQAVNELVINNPIGALPAGSGNDFFRSHHISTDFTQAFNHLIAITEATQHDILLIKGSGKKYLVNSLGVGADGRVVQNIHKKRDSGKLGSLAYLTPALKVLFRQKAFDAKIKILGKEIKVNKTLIILFMNNGSIGGGINVYPEADTTDGYIDVVFSHRLNLIDLLQIAHKILTHKRLIDHPKAYHVRAKEVEVEVYADEYWQADGEPWGNKQQSYKITTLKQNFWI